MLHFGQVQVQVHVHVQVQVNVQVQVQVQAIQNSLVQSIVLQERRDAPIYSQVATSKFMGALQKGVRAHVNMQGRPSYHGLMLV